MSSSRRTTGDINILAMLDGQISGRRPRVLPAALRYGAAGVLACSLLATLVWLVQDDAPARDAGKDDAAQASLHSGAAGPTARPAGATALRDTQPAGTHEVELVVTQRDDLFPARDSRPVSVPGKGTAPAAEASASTTPVPASAPLPRQLPPPATTPARTAAASALPVNATRRGAVIIDMLQPAPTATPASTAATAIPAAPAHAAADGHVTTHTTAQAFPPARTPSLARTMATTPHQKRGAAASRTAPPAAVDTDVAVISAILQHTAARSEATDTAPAPACPDRSCATRMQSRQ
ncbi:MAG: hypothetical protein JF619_17845 [Massilia sp.]|nr:hypothetical protein [Massilia sp.]